MIRNHSPHGTRGKKCRIQKFKLWKTTSTNSQQFQILTWLILSKQNFQQGLLNDSLQISHLYHIELLKYFFFVQHKSLTVCISEIINGLRLPRHLRDKLCVPAKVFQDKVQITKFRYSDIYFPLPNKSKVYISKILR